MYTPTGEKISTPGLHYLLWKLDKAATNLPGAWMTEESRGIQVLPGQYQIVVGAGDTSDTTSVRVIEDPRFELNPEVDKQLYDYQKAVYVQVERLSEPLLSLDSKTEGVQKAQDYLKDTKPGYFEAHKLHLEAMLSAIKTVRAIG